MNKQIIGRFINLRIIQLIARLILGGTFFYASLDKIAFPREFAKIVIKYHILPEKIAAYFAFLLPWIELFLGIFLIIGLLIRESAFVLSFLLLSFMIAITIKTLDGTIENCGCLSTAPDARTSLGILLGRDLLLLIVSILLVINGKKKPFFSGTQ
jgi:uncharacterized membrane protein YphA (DoxX/SURF4 family)